MKTVGHPACSTSNRGKRGSYQGKCQGNEKMTTPICASVARQAEAGWHQGGHKHGNARKTVNLRECPKTSERNRTSENAMRTRGVSTVYHMPKQAERFKETKRNRERKMAEGRTCTTCVQKQLTREREGRKIPESTRMHTESTSVRGQVAKV